jgi:hypothetical protein
MDIPHSHVLSISSICFSSLSGTGAPLPNGAMLPCPAGTGANRIGLRDTLEEISLWMILTGAPRAVVASRQPGGRLRAAFVEAGRTFLVVVEDPRTALAEAVRRRPNDAAAAAQLVASSCAGITRYVSSPGALALFRDREAAIS